MRLTDDELRDVLTRAEEIQRGLRRDDEMNAELEACPKSLDVASRTQHHVGGGDPRPTSSDSAPAGVR